MTPRALGGLAAWGLASVAIAQESAVDFEQQIEPILARACYECHGASEQKVGLRLDRRATALAGSDFGEYPVIVPGDADASLLFQLVEEGAMPPSGHTVLAPEEVELLRRWIDGGALWPDDGLEASWSSAHWSYQPLERPSIPENEAAHPIDAFLSEAWTERGLRPAGRASRGVLLRRASLDLRGLPPTPTEFEQFAGDDAPGAWERALDRLLESPAYGEQQARRWLDLARYADSNGYEKDAARSIWLYRDWVVDAWNEDLSLDRFTTEQLAGDLLPEATERQRIATGFHRNTLTNEEGGVDPEEYRVAAVVDRVNTTAEVWLGMTMGCAQCHDHKYDAITQRDYFRLFDVFNQTTDGGSSVGPVLETVAPKDRAQALLVDRELAAYDAGQEERRKELEPWLVSWAAALRRTLERAPFATPRDHVVVGGTRPLAHRVEGAWNPRVAADPEAFEGDDAIVQTATGFEQHYFEGARVPFVLGESSRFFVHVWIDPAAPTRELMLQFHEANGDWEHRAFLGEDLHGLGTSGTDSRRRIGELPETGAWRRIEVDPSDVGLEVGDRVDGLAFGQWDGRVLWDHAGVTSDAPRTHAGVPDEVAAALLEWRGSLVPDVAVEWFEESSPHAARARADRAAIEARRPRPVQTLVLEAVDERRVTRVLERGSFLAPSDVVEAAVPSLLDPHREIDVRDRLAFSQWLVSPANPLTPRVLANRLWAWTFGRGLVTTLDDFGTRGAQPTHPELLDWLASELIANGWSAKRFFRLLMTSDAYQRAATRSAADQDRDPDAAYLAWFPRRRLDGEELRDQALGLAGLLNEERGGPPVYPPQPNGTDNATYAGNRWNTSQGAAAHRRALYTFWRRTSPYPTFAIFDAPSRELTCPERDRSNTPLQALALLNDPNFVEAAKAFGRRIEAEGLSFCFEAATGRAPEAGELEILEALLASDGALATAQVLLSLDEVISR